ncbi:unnamed protein product, partial [Prorocentrum cordatum]
KMEDRVGRDGEALAWGADEVPASAKSYYLRVLKQGLEKDTSLRNLREMHTVCVALDHLALGRTRTAADVLAQRLKALGLASTHGTWEKAQPLELVDPEGATLVDKEEELEAVREVALERRLGGKGAWPTYGSDSWKSGAHSTKGKGKQDPWAASKSKGKGHNSKGKSSDWSGRRELLPINPELGEPYLDERVRASRGFGGRSETFGAISDAANMCLAALNFLACAGWTSTPICCYSQPILSKAQERTLDHIWTASADLFSAADEKFDSDAVSRDLGNKRVNYQGESVSRRRELIADRVLPTWPSDGEARLFPVEEFVVGELREDILDPARCLLPEVDWPRAAPRLRNHASDDEWYQRVAAGAKLGIFGQVAAEDMFRGVNGEMVLNGAMGVDDILVTDSEDMKSCFNLFRMPDAWACYFAYEKQVAESAFGGDPHKLAFVYIRSAPMGWLGAVDVMQAMARRYVFQFGGVHRNTELRKDQPIPEVDISLVCLDGFDFIRHAQVIGGRHGAGIPERSAERQRFAQACKELGLPLNVRKSLVCGVRAAILGGELDGSRGVFRHTGDKSARLILKTAVLLSQEKWAQAALQHWAGTFCFGAKFRRPIFSTLQNAFTFLSADAWGRSALIEPPSEVWDELLVCCALIPLTFTSLRAPIRKTISAIDASETGGGASEARKFAQALDSNRAEQVEGWECAVMEESGGPSQSFVLFVLERLRWRLRNWGFAVAQCPLGQWDWGIGLAKELYFQSGIWFAIVPGSPANWLEATDARLLRYCEAPHKALHVDLFSRGDMSFPWHWHFRHRPRRASPLGEGLQSGARARCAGVVRDAPAEWASQCLPFAPSRRPRWTPRALAKAAARLARPEVAATVAEDISMLLESMRAGGELEHLTSMARAADYQGADVHLMTQTLVEGRRQAIPYPAFAWDWTEAQAYQRAQTQHINALELAAFLIFVRSRAGSVDFHVKRFFHVSD